jgi:hypothetical protein
MTTREVGAIVTRRHITRLIRDCFFEKKAYGNQACLSNRIRLAYPDIIEEIAPDACPPSLCRV